MATSGVEIAGSTAARDAARDWEAVRAAADIQFAPLPKLAPPEPSPPSEPPEWLKALLEWLGSLVRPIAEAIGMSWPAFRWTLIALTVAGLLLLAWRIVAPRLGRRARSEEARPGSEWTPAPDAAMALLDEADRLAAEGNFDEATHLLLRRSVRQIAEARPDWLRPASTAREIASLPQLPERARNAFEVIASRVERSFFALRTLDADDWRAARAAYAAFALQKFPEGSLAA